MKKFFLLMALCLTTVFAAQAKQIYAAWTASTQTMTLYYDDQMEARDGTTNWWENDVLRAAKIVVLDESMKDARPTSTAYWFNKFEQLTNIQHLDYLNTSEVTSMHAMFQNCWKLSGIDLRLFDTQKVTDMSFMFESCWSLTSLNVNNFNIYKVEDMQAMFQNCSSLTTIYCNNSWDGISAESANMFYNCKVLKGGNGTKCNGTSNIDATYARPDGVNSKKGYFTWTEEIYAVWDASTTTLTIYYDKDRRANGGVKYWWNMSEYANAATKIVLDASMQNARPISTKNWFSGFEQLTMILNLNYLNTSEVTDMSQMFSGCKKLQSLILPSNFITDNVTDMTRMFYGCDALKSITFGNNFTTANVTNMSNMFVDCLALTSLDLSRFNTAKVQDMRAMFYGCKALKSLNLGENFYTANVTDMGYMFADCLAMTSLDLSRFNTSNVTDMSYMFKNCEALKSLNLSSFSIDKVGYMQAMFSNCSSLATIYCNEDWSKNSQLASNSYHMFYGCSKLVGGEGTVYNESNTNVTYARPDEGSANPGYFTATAPKQVYTEYKDGTLTYYYDFKYDSRTGTVEPYDPVNKPYKIRFAGYAANVNKAVIDPSMKDAPLTSAYAMFYGNSSDSRLINMTAIEGLENLKTSAMTDMSFMFESCNKLESLDVSSFNTANVTKMEEMFYGCYKLKYIDTRLFNTAKVTTMRLMFGNCYELTSLDLTSFNTANVWDVSGMFVNCHALTTIYCDKDWTKSSKMNTYDNMFKGCEQLVGEEGTACDGKNYIDRSYARPDGGVLAPGYFTPVKQQVYTEFDESTGTLTYFYDDLRHTRKGRTAGYNPGNKSTVRFRGYNDLILTAVIDPSMKNAPLSSTFLMFNGNSESGTEYALSNLIRIDGMENLNTAEVWDMSWMFDKCYSLKSIDLRWFNTEKVAYMDGMFSNCESLTSLNLSSFNMEKVNSIDGMFAYCSQLTTIYCDKDWSTSKNLMHITNNMFAGCSSLVGGNGTAYSEENIDAFYARPDGLDGKPGYFTAITPKTYTVFDEATGTLTYYYNDQWATREDGTVELYEPVKYPDATRFERYGENVVKARMNESMKNAPLTSTRRMFNGMSGMLTKLTRIEGLDYLNTANVTDMESMFDMCYELQSIDLSHFNTSNVTNMKAMFAECQALQSINLSSFNTANVTNMGWMFYACTALTSLNLSHFNTSNVTNMQGMFNKCGVTSLDLRQFDIAKVVGMAVMFRDCKDLTTIYCDKDWSKNSVLKTSENMFQGCTRLVGGKGTTYHDGYLDITYARPDKDGQPGYFTSDAQGVEQITNDKCQMTNKVLRNGQLFIERGGKMYNVQGARVK